MDESHDQTARSDGDAKPGKRRSPHIALFDHSVDNFFAAMDSISALCSEPSHEAFPPAQIERFSSMILFLKEWRQFYYEPKVVNFSFETESVRVNDFSEGITLPQFSSASVSVPEMEPLPENLRSSSRSDFVLHAGGSVWALDWCPRIDEKTDGQVNCEYLAVAAHPPGASYHKIGAPLVGRGLIQIWCLLSMDKKVLSQANPPGKGRPRIKQKLTETEVSDDLNQNDFSSIRRSRGRPRKRHAEDDVLHDSDNKEIFHLPKPRGRPRKIEKLSADDLTSGEIFPVRPRGRPRKHMKQGVNSPDNVNGLILVRSNGSPKRTLESIDEKKEAPPSTDHVILSTMEYGGDANVDAGEVVVEVPISGDMKKEPSAPKRRGRPRKKPLLSVDKIFSASAVALDEPPMNNGEPLSTNAHITSLDVALSSYVSVNLGVNSEPNAPKRKGRPRKKPWSSVNKYLPESVAELQADVSGNGVLTSTHECIPTSHIDVGNVAVPMATSGNLVVEEESCVCSVDDTPAYVVEGDVDAYGSNLISSRNTCLPPLNADLRHVASPLPTSASSIITGKLFVSSLSGQHGESIISSANKDVLTPGVYLEANVSGSSPTLNSNDSMIPLDSDSGKATMFPTSGDTHVEEELFVSRPRGRPINKFIRSTRKNVSTSGVDLKLFSNPELATSRENFSSNCCQSEVIVEDSCEGVTNGREETMPCSRVPENIALPMVVLSLAHNGKVAWDVKWRPKTSSKSESKQHIGYLAVLLGNGSLEVWEVPHPSLVRSLYISSRIEGTDPRFLKLEPVFKCSKIKCGDRQCIPLILEWSHLASSDLMLAGCHDGTVALWKFSSQCPSQDAKPLLCFTADTGPIRAVAWAPEESDPESSNLVVTTGQEGLKFWDLRDPHRPLWEPYPVQRTILSLEWMTDPRCIIISLDDGTLRIFSLWNLANDGSVNGKPSDGMKQHPAWHLYHCSSFALWSIQVSRSTGLAAYCGAEGSAYYFQLTVNSLKDSRNRVPHLLCGSLIKDDQTLKIITPMLNSPSLVTKHLSECAATSQSILDQSGPKDSKPSLPGNRISFLPEMKRPKSKPKHNVQDVSKQLVQNSEHGYREAESGFLVLPPKILAMHRVRWNLNKGSERWLCYGGAAGIVRCQEIT